MISALDIASPMTALLLFSTLTRRKGMVVRALAHPALVALGPLCYGAYLVQVHGRCYTSTVTSQLTPDSLCSLPRSFPPPSPLPRRLSSAGSRPRVGTSTPPTPPSSSSCSSSSFLRWAKSTVTGRCASSSCAHGDGSPPQAERGKALRLHRRPPRRRRRRRRSACSLETDVDAVSELM